MVGNTSRLKSDPQKVLSENIVEDAAAQGAIFVEDFIHNILKLISYVAFP